MAWQANWAQAIAWQQAVAAWSQHLAVQAASRLRRDSDIANSESSIDVPAMPLDAVAASDGSVPRGPCGAASQTATGEPLLQEVRGLKGGLAVASEICDDAQSQGGAESSGFIFRRRCRASGQSQASGAMGAHQPRLARASSRGCLDLLAHGSTVVVAARRAMGRANLPRPTLRRNTRR